MRGKRCINEVSAQAQKAVEQLRRQGYDRNEADEVVLNEIVAPPENQPEVPEPEQMSDEEFQVINDLLDREEDSEQPYQFGAGTT